MAEEVQINLARAYQQYTAEVQQEIFAVQDRISREMLREVIDTSPVSEPYRQTTDRPPQRRNSRQSGQYQRGWKLRKIRKPTRYIIMAYNSTDSPLTHLIDLGHRTKNGGYYSGNKHISDAQKHANDKLTAEIERILR